MLLSLLTVDLFMHACSDEFAPIPSYTSPNSYRFFSLPSRHVQPAILSPTAAPAAARKTHLSVQETGKQPRGSPPHHGHSFIRRCVLCGSRAKTVNFTTAIFFVAAVFPRSLSSVGTAGPTICNILIQGIFDVLYSA